MNHLMTRGEPRYALRCALGLLLASSMLLAACGGGGDTSAPAAENTAENSGERGDAAAAPTADTSTNTRAQALADAPAPAPPPGAAWTWCATEGGVCTVPATVTVRYGANGTYSYRTVTGSVACTNAVWGDPVFGTVKSCEYTSSAPAPGTAGWTDCAAEGGVCNLPAPGNVRYGANGSYYYKTASTTIACNNEVFGDPAFGTRKSCAYESSAAAPTPTPADSWVTCATEGGVCNFSGTRNTRYGTNGVYFFRTVTASIGCNNTAWGGDPVFGVSKSCAYDSGSTPAPAPSPPPGSPPPGSPPPTTGTATLAWGASTDSRVSGYRVYWGTAPGNYQQARGVGLAAGTATSYTVRDLPAGRTYYFAVTAHDASGNESLFSSEASKAIP